IIEIGKEQNLNVEEMGQLSLETNMAMLGFTDINKFEQSVKNSLKFTDEKTKTIVNAENEKILKEIREKMKETYSEGPKTETPESPSKPVAPIIKPMKPDKDTEILSSAGIKIVPEKVPEKTLEKTESLLSQKMSGPVQAPTVKTNYSPEKSPAPSANRATPAKEGVKRVDPYREIPE
ncbi:MAG: hypothetical protein ACREGC_02775, partial [Minisyncoccia bacterium]